MILIKDSIPGDAIAKKNSQRIVWVKKRPSIRPSTAYDLWEIQALQYLIMQRHEPIVNYPVELHLFFWRKTKRKFDYGNLSEGLQDVLQKAGIIEDDSMRHLIPVIDGWGIDRINPRIDFTIRNDRSEIEIEKDQVMGYKKGE